MDGDQQVTEAKPRRPRAAESAAEPETAAPGAAKFDALVETWWNDHFPGSAVARHTEIWNHAHRAKEELKRRLAAQ